MSSRDDESSASRDCIGGAYDAVAPVESERDHGSSTSEDPPPVNALDARRDRAVTTSHRLSTHSTELVDVAAELRSRATQLRIAASEVGYWNAPHDGGASAARSGWSTPWFTVRGLVDGRPTSARWWPDHLECDHDVRQRTHVIVAMDERFTAPWAFGPGLAASLEGPPVAVLLTVMRAFSRVTAIDLSVALVGDIGPSIPRHG